MLSDTVQWIAALTMILTSGVMLVAIWHMSDLRDALGLMRHDRDYWMREADYWRDKARDLKGKIDADKR